MSDDGYNYDKNNPNQANQPISEQPASENKAEKNKKDDKFQGFVKQLMPKIGKVIEDKFTKFDQESQEHFEYVENVTEGILKASKDLEASAKSYAKNFERFNKRHISFSDLPKRVKAYVFGGLFITLAAGFGLGVFGQEKLSVYDPSGGWHNYVIETHLKPIQRCWSEARRTGQPTNCNVVEKP